jgi:SAM-dependent methyltransferase
MRPAVRDQLLQLNRAFYQNLAGPFAATRARPQPGVVRALAAIDRQASVLDVGCGHGLAAAQLAHAGHAGRYLGVDGSQQLIDLAKKQAVGAWSRFLLTDLSDPAWPSQVSTVLGGPFDWGLAFAVLHHLPGDELRRRVVEQLRSLLSPAATAAVSVWDFPDDERMRQRIVAWETVGLTQADVEPEDFLLDWRHEGRGVRYVHRFPSAGLTVLAKGGGFDVLEEYRSDGEDGQMGLYQIWRARS